MYCKFSTPVAFLNDRKKFGNVLVCREAGKMKRKTTCNQPSPSFRLPGYFQNEILLKILYPYKITLINLSNTLITVF